MPRENFELKDKVIVVTGASAGIGAALIPLLQDRGAKLALIGRSKETLSRLARPGDLVEIADLAQPPRRASVIAACVSEFGRIDVLVNNAGAGAYGSTITMPDRVARDVFEVNFFAPLELCQLAAPHITPGGMIVNVASVGGKMVLPWMTLYSASKYAITALTDALRIELQPAGIDTLGVFPGHVRTEFQKHVLYGSAPQIISPTRNRFTISSEECARAIVRAMERRSRTLVIPAIYWFPIWLSRLLPGVFEKQLLRMMAEIGSAES